MLSDPDKAVGTQYQVLREPDDKFANFPQRLSYLINPEGTIAAAYEVGDPAGHGAAVLADLDALKR